MKELIDQNVRYQKMYHFVFPKFTGYMEVSLSTRLEYIKEYYDDELIYGSYPYLIYGPIVLESKLYFFGIL